MFKVNNKDTPMTPMAFTPCSSVSIVNFEHVIASWEVNDCLMQSLYQGGKKC